MAEPTAHTETPAEARVPAVRGAALSLAAPLADADLRSALRADVARGVAAHRRDPGRAQRRITDDLAAAQRFKEQSDAANAAYQKSLADARARAQAIANETRQRQAAEAEATNKRLEAQLHEKLAAAEQSIAATRAAAMGNVGSIATETAAAIVERLIGTAPAEPDVAAAVGEVLR